MRSPESDSKLLIIQQQWTELRRLGASAGSGVMEARIAAEEAAVSSLQLLAEADRVLFRR